MHVPNNYKKKSSIQNLSLYEVFVLLVHFADSSDYKS